MLYMVVTPPSYFPLRQLAALPWRGSHHALPAALFYAIVWLELRAHATGWKPYVGAAVITLLLGFAGEIVQIWIPYRSARVGDLIPNAQGVAGAWLLIFALSLLWAMLNGTLRRTRRR